MDRDTTYMSRSPSPGVHEASSPATESGWLDPGERRRFLTALGTKAEAVQTGVQGGRSLQVRSPVRPSRNWALWYGPLNVDTTILYCRPGVSEVSRCCLAPLATASGGNTRESLNSRVT